MTGHLLLIIGSVGFGIASALIPIINAEAYVLAVCATAGLWPASFSMVALVLGTLVGKLILFMGARHRDKLGRLLGRHSKDVSAAEEHVARMSRGAESEAGHVARRIEQGVEAEIAAGEAAMLQAAARRARHHPQDAVADDAELTRADAELTRADALAQPLVAADPLTAAPGPIAEPPRKRVRWPAWVLRWRRAIVDWGDRALAMLDHPWQSFIVLMTSASLGVPPLAITTIAAGLRKTNLGIFIFCVIVGRAIRFGVIAVPTLMARF